MTQLSPVTFTDFGHGLNLRDQPFLVDFGSALDALNVEFSERGSVRQRGGYAQFTAVEFSNQPDCIYPHLESDGTKQLLVGNGNRIDAVNTSGTVVASTVAPTAGPHFFTRFGGPTAEVTYIANGTDQVRAYDGAAFTAPAGLVGQTGKFLAIAPKSNRLVVARETGATLGNNPSSVNFSAVAAPEDFTAANGAGSVDLDPGDGEAIMGMVAWRDALCVAKQSKLFWFHGESGGTSPIWFYDKIDVGGIGLAASAAICAGRDGVYFLGRDGVYRTRGAEPELLSDAIGPFFDGNASIYYGSSTLDHGNIDRAAMWFHNERIYLAVPTGSSTANNRLLVFDPRYGWWSIFDMGVSCGCSFRTADQPEVVFGAAEGVNHLYRHKTGVGRYTADGMTSSGTGGVAISSRWKGGWSDLGTQDKKQIDGVELYGTGSCSATVKTDYNFSGGYGQAIQFTAEEDRWDSSTWDTDTWGPTAVITRKAHDSGYGATTVSLEITNSTINESWALNVATFQVASRQPTGIK